MSKKQIEVYKIESGVPMADYNVLPPLDLMDVGDSVVFPIKKRPSVQTVASRLKKEQGKEFTVRRLDQDSGRVWRTK